MIFHYKEELPSRIRTYHAYHLAPFLFRKSVFIAMFRTIADFLYAYPVPFRFFFTMLMTSIVKRPLLIKSSAQAAASITFLNACTAKHHCRAWCFVYQLFNL